MGSFVVSVRWGHGRVWGERVGDRSVPAGRTTLSNLTPGLRGDDGGGDMQVGGVQFPEHPPPHPTATSPPFPKKKAPEPPLTLVLFSSNLPPLNTPPLLPTLFF